MPSRQLYKDSDVTLYDYTDRSYVLVTTDKFAKKNAAAVKTARALYNAGVTPTAGTKGGWMIAKSNEAGVMFLNDITGLKLKVKAPAPKKAKKATGVYEKPSVDVMINGTQVNANRASKKLLKEVEVAQKDLAKVDSSQRGGMTRKVNTLHRNLSKYVDEIQMGYDKGLGSRKRFVGTMGRRYIKLDEQAAQVMKELTKML